MNQLQQITARMLEIERINMAYNRATNFGEFPNGQETYIEVLLAEWDRLKALRNQLKQPQPINDGDPDNNAGEKEAYEALNNEARKTGRIY